MAACASETLRAVDWQIAFDHARMMAEPLELAQRHAQAAGALRDLEVSTPSRPPGNTPSEWANADLAEKRSASSNTSETVLPSAIFSTAR